MLSFVFLCCLLADSQQTFKAPTHLRCAIPGARTGETRATSTCPTPGSLRRTWPRTSGPSIGLKASRRLLPRRSERTCDRRCDQTPERPPGCPRKGFPPMLGRVPPTFFWLHQLQCQCAWSKLVTRIFLFATVEQRLAKDDLATGVL